jgi:hypothetical protein
LSRDGRGGLAHAGRRARKKVFPILIATMMKRLENERENYVTSLKQLQILIERMKVSGERYRLDDYIGLVLLL